MGYFFFFFNRENSSERIELKNLGILSRYWRNLEIYGNSSFSNWIYLYGRMIFVD